MSRSSLLVTLLLAIAATVSDAHHSIAGVYDRNRPVEVEGRVAEFQFISPHPILIIDVADVASAPELWLLEMDNRSELARIGITGDTYRPGDRVVAQGSMARAEPRRLYLRRLERPADGTVYEQVGNTPRFAVCLPLVSEPDCP
jgi:hypothetical protein